MTLVEDVSAGTICSIVFSGKNPRASMMRLSRSALHPAIDRSDIP
jgi:hypothetical protein